MGSLLIESATVLVWERSDSRGCRCEPPGNDRDNDDHRKKRSNYVDNLWHFGVLPSTV